MPYKRLSGNPHEGLSTQGAKLSTDQMNRKTSTQVEILDDLMEQYREQRGGLLPLLHAVQRELDYIPDEAVPRIAGCLNISRAEVHGVLTFCHDSRRKPAGRCVVKLCRAEACRARGSDEIERRVSESLGIVPGQTSIDGAVSLDGNYCLGLCATGPNALVDSHPMSRWDASRLEHIPAELQA